jgi:metallo-beta-lactamase family protein
MKLSFHGAAREVTGSCHLLEVNGRRVLLDCGMVQGGKERHERNREPFPFEPSGLRCVVLSHAHIDHSGRLPLLVKAGFRGPILATEATVELTRILLADAAHIHEEDARWKVKQLRKRGEDSSWVSPLFGEEEGLAAAERLVPVAFDRPYELDGIGRVTFVKAGHILGAAIVDLELRHGGRPRRLVFSGDLGVGGARLLGAPEPRPCPDDLLIESTYGDRARQETADRTELLHQVIDRTAHRGGKLVIPSFAIGRTQEILARLNDLVEAGRLGGLPIYVDSPMAEAATKVFATHSDAWSDEARRGLRCGDQPLEFPGLRFTRSVEESIAINESPGPAVILAASGMCTAGRVKHHLRHTLPDRRGAVLFVGYQAQGTLGRAIQSGTSPVRIFGAWYPVRARVETIEGFSAHADREELLAWFGALRGIPRRTYVVHGEEQAALSFATALREKFGARVEVPERGQGFPLD